MSITLAMVIAVVGVALVFAYTNGFHDAANAVATSVSTRALTPRIALALAAIMNLAGALLGALLGQAVANTVGEVITPPSDYHGLVIVLAGLLGAIAWNMITWAGGLPSSSTHALIGGLGGAGIAAGTGVNWDTVATKVLLPMIVSPLVAFAAAYVLMIVILWIFRRAEPGRTNRGFRVMQTISAAGMALGHGLQDAQKTMGVVFLALVAGGYASTGDDLPLWVILTAAVALALGTWVGGWRIIRTLGRRIADLEPPQGFAAETVAAGILCTTAFVQEVPISTTHTITSAVVGVGATKRMSAVRWFVARRILTAWVLTFPAAAAIAGLLYLLIHGVAHI